MEIKNALIFKKGAFSTGRLFAEDGLISENSRGQVLDASNLYALPGFVDIHFHGCMGVEFTSTVGAGLEKIAAFQAQNGVTTICPATLTLKEEQIVEALQTACNYAPKDDMASLGGVYLEGPFISPQKAGAQNPKYISPPDINLAKRLISASKGLAKVITVAPEEEGAIEFIEALKDDISISVAHTAAGYDTALQAFKKGASHVTHMFNAMGPIQGRDPSVIGAALDGGATAELICDGVHLHKTTVLMALALFSHKRIIFVSDSMEATGLGDGHYTIGGLPVAVRGKEARLQSGAIAGSVTHLFDCFRWAVSIGVPLEQAILCATQNPAKRIGIFEKCGSLDAGKSADILLLDKDLNLKHVILRGKLLF